MGGSSSKSFDLLLTNKKDPPDVTGTDYSVQTRCFEFIYESNILARQGNINTAIKQELSQGSIDGLAQGHVGALSQAIELALDHKPIGLNHIKDWHARILTEQGKWGTMSASQPGSFAGNSTPWEEPRGRLLERITVSSTALPTAVGQFLLSLNHKLALHRSQQQDKGATDNVVLAALLPVQQKRKQPPPNNVVIVAQMVAEAIHGFTILNPFVDGTGRIARLIAQYIVVSCGYCPIVLHAKRGTEYTHGLREPAALAVLVVDALTRSVFAPQGGLLLRAGSSKRDIYMYKNKEHSKTVKVEWTGVTDALAAWKGIAHPIVQNRVLVLEDSDGEGGGGREEGSGPIG